MSLQTKIKALAMLFGLKSVIHFADGIIAALNGASYSDYGNAFIVACIAVYISYVVYNSRTKWTYWIVVLFSGLVIVRSAVVLILTLYTGTVIVAELIMLGAVYSVLFGLTPLLILTARDVRVAFSVTTGSDRTKEVNIGS